jgi:hypothetical protein
VTKASGFESGVLEWQAVGSVVIYQTALFFFSHPLEQNLIAQSIGLFLFAHFLDATGASDRSP